MSHPNDPHQIQPFAGIDKPGLRSPATYSGLAIASCVLGVLSFLFSCITGFFGVALGLLALFSINKSNGAKTGAGFAVTGIVLSAILSMIMPLLLLPAVQQFREAAREVQTGTNMRLLSLAVANYHETRQHLPTNIAADDGAPLLSWRVAILPFIEQSNLYDQFHLDEPWDSPHNRSLLPLMPEVFDRPGVDLDQQGFTVFKRAEGTGAMFGQDPNMQGETKVGWRHIIDGVSNTVWLAEVAESDAVEWTRPADYQWNPEQPKSGLGESRYVFLAFGDCSVIKVDLKTMSTETIKAAFTRNGGEISSIHDEAVMSQPGF